MAKNKNRKRGDNGPVFPAPLAAILALVSAFALTFLWLNGRCDELGLRIKQLEKDREALHRKIVNEEYKWSNMTSPQNMQKLLDAHGLTMTWPSEKNIIRIRRSDFTESSAPAPAHAQFAKHSARETEFVND